MYGSYQTHVEVTPMYGSQQSQGRETGGCVEVSPNVRKSAELRAMEIIKVKEKRKVDV